MWDKLIYSHVTASLLIVTFIVFSPISCTQQIVDRTTRTGGDGGPRVYLDDKNNKLFNTDDGDTVVIYNDEGLSVVPTNSVYLHVTHTVSGCSSTQYIPPEPYKKLAVSKTFHTEGYPTFYDIERSSCGKEIIITYSLVVENIGKLPIDQYTIHDTIPENMEVKKVEQWTMQGFGKAVSAPYPFNVIKGKGGSKILVIKSKTALITKSSYSFRGFSTFVQGYGITCKYKVPIIKDNKAK